MDNKYQIQCTECGYTGPAPDYLLPKCQARAAKGFVDALPVAEVDCPDCQDCQAAEDAKYEGKYGGGY